MDEVSIVDFHVSHTGDLLKLLLKLHRNHFQENAPKALVDLKAERDIKKTYKSYVEDLNESNGDDWIIYLAKSASGEIIGFIIGSIINDEELVNGNMGIIEDWFVEDAYRGKGIGGNLYKKLETWLKKSGCDQVISDTWQGNTRGINAHEKMGFFISGISFSKKI